MQNNFLLRPSPFNETLPPGCLSELIAQPSEIRSIDNSHIARSSLGVWEEEITVPQVTVVGLRVVVPRIRHKSQAPGDTGTSRTAGFRTLVDHRIAGRGGQMAVETSH